MTVGESKQKPLTAPFGRDAHDFSQSNADWEAAVFDNATRFHVIDYGARPRSVTPYPTMAESVFAAIANPRACVYAVTEEGRYGRSVLLDREAWADWVIREKRLKEQEK